MKNQDQLITKVIEDIEELLESGDTEAVYELLTYVPKKNLIFFLNEGEWNEYATKEEINQMINS